MKLRKRTLWRLALLAAGAVLAAGLIAPRLDADRFGGRIRQSLEQALGRRVEIGKVRLDLFNGPGFSVDRVVIYDGPRPEPFAYVESLEARVSFASFWSGRLEFATLRLVNPSINLVKPGMERWNFEELLTRTAGAASGAGARLPEIQVRGGRINFKFRDTKSIFYFLDATLDALPPSSAGGEWRIRFEGQPARTDRPALGFGTLTARGRWRPDPRTGGRVEIFVDLERNSLAEIIRLVHGHDIGVHGQITSRARLEGPVSDIAITGRAQVGDIHRWDLLPPHGDGWPLEYRGRLDLVSQQLELETAPPAGGGPLPISFRLRASGHFGEPRWGVVATVDHLPLAPLEQVARHMGIALPQAVAFEGDLNGVLGYSPAAGFQGMLRAQSGSVNLPGAEPMRLSQAELTVAGSNVILSPALFEAGRRERATLAGAYSWNTQALHATIFTDGMSVPGPGEASRRLLGPLPILANCRGGTWRGELEYSQHGDQPGEWSGSLQIERTQVEIAGLAEPVVLDRARVTIEDGATAVERIAGRAGAVEFKGEYRYRPKAARPHLFHFAIPAADAAELERLLLPALARRESFLSRALRLGRSTVPEWLEARHADGTLDIGSLALAEVTLSKVRAHVRWDGPAIDVSEFAARFGDGSVTGLLAANLRRATPSYRLNARFRGVAWLGGKWDGKTQLAASGTGLDLLRSLHVEGAFDGRSVSLGADTEFKTVSGSYVFTLARSGPHFRFTDLQATMGEDTYQGTGATGSDGRLYFELTDGTKQMRMSGTLSPFQLEQVAARSPGE